MWKRSELKKEARGALKRNYWNILIVCALVAILMGTFRNPISKIESFVSLFQETDAMYSALENGEDITEMEDTTAGNTGGIADAARLSDMSNTDIVDSFLGGVGMEDSSAKQWTKGILSTLADNAEGAGSVFYGFLNTINQALFKDRIGPSVVIATGTLIQLLILIFIKTVIQASYARYMLETRRYSKTSVSRLFFPWRIKRGRKIAKTMFVKMLFQWLWCLTIIGGIIKRYSYRMVPFIVAENPNLKPREAINLSREMMNGNKWNAFKLDLSFLLWGILNYMTFGLLNIFYVTPYKMLTNTELYMKLRAETQSKALCDTALDVEIQDCEYPDDAYFIPVTENRKWLKSDYNKKYCISSLILIFFAFSFIGWVWEVSLHLFKDGVFVDRGTSYGPWLPIYGSGVLLILIVLKKVRKSVPLTFVCTMVLCGVVEYFTSYILEQTRGLKYWDYTGYFMNIGGRTCLEGLLVFAIGGCAAVYLVAPALDSLFMKIPKKVKYSLCTALLAVFMADQVYSHFHPNQGKGITDYGDSAAQIKERLCAAVQETDYHL